MKLQDLETKIAERADGAVQKKIKVFKAEIDAALTKLFGGGGARSCEQFGNYEYADTVTRKRDQGYEIANAKLSALRIAIRDTTESSPQTKLTWPAVLWETEREAIRNDLLAKMDLMQQLLAASPRDTSDDVPCEGGANIV